MTSTVDANVSKTVK